MAGLDLPSRPAKSLALPLTSRGPAGSRSSESSPRPVVETAADASRCGSTVSGHDGAPDRASAIGPGDDELTGVGELPSELTKESEASYVGPDLRPAGSEERDLGDFTTSMDTVRLVPLAVLIGVLGAGISIALLDMMGLITTHH